MHAREHSLQQARKEEAEGARQATYTIAFVSRHRTSTALLLLLLLLLWPLARSGENKLLTFAGGGGSGVFSDAKERGEGGGALSPFSARGRRSVIRLGWVERNAEILIAR